MMQAKLLAHFASTATCESIGKGISVLGCMLVHRNPTLDERKAISDLHPGFDWEPFGKAPDDKEDPGPPLLVEFMNLIDQNADQTSFHTASTLNAAFKKFKTARPWFTKERSFYVQSGMTPHFNLVCFLEFIYYFF